MDVVEIELGELNCIDLAQNRDRRRALVNSVMNLQVPYNFGKIYSGFKAGDLSSSAQLHS
jgi:hypothetical protein